MAGGQAGRLPDTAQCLVTLSQLVAPMIPFLAERMYRNSSWGTTPTVTTVCTCPNTPRPPRALLDPELNKGWPPHSKSSPWATGSATNPTSGSGNRYREISVFDSQSRRTGSRGQLAEVIADE
ncbi:MAG: hypothetical protein Ct9H300mP1_30440 [Planctomycetaceae bacterium]|nr:MAG: hypothetical protein Ct9H300mP1_30440 [Planctomycetaceae bacterium]